MRILLGKDINETHLRQIMDIDEEVYSKEYTGVYENLKARFDKNNDTFVCLENNGTIIGYINYLPTTKALYEDIKYNSNVIRDDDITPDELSGGGQVRTFISFLSPYCPNGKIKYFRTRIGQSHCWLRP